MLAAREQWRNDSIEVMFIFLWFNYHPWSSFSNYSPSQTKRASEAKQVWCTVLY